MKIIFRKWMGILPAIIILLISLSLWFLSSLNIEQVPLILIAILLLVYYLTFSYSGELFDFGQLKLINDEKILQLEKDNTIYILAWLNGIGIAFLIPGLNIISTYPIMAFSGFILIIIANIIYNMNYLPVYFLLKINAYLDYKDRKT